MTYPNKNFMVDFKSLCCCFSFLSIFLPEPENVLFRNAFAVAPKPQRHPPAATHHSRSSARFSEHFRLCSLRLAPALYPTSEKCMCCLGNERIDPFRRPNFSF